MMQTPQRCSYFQGSSLGWMTSWQAMNQRHQEGVLEEIHLHHRPASNTLLLKASRCNKLRKHRVSLRMLQWLSPIILLPSLGMLHTKLPRMSPEMIVGLPLLKLPSLRVPLEQPLKLLKASRRNKLPQHRVSLRMLHTKLPKMSPEMMVGLPLLKLPPFKVPLEWPLKMLKMRPLLLRGLSLQNVRSPHHSHLPCLLSESS